MNRTSKVSIIVPVHNAEEYLEESIGSLVNQTLKDIEIICVDDASTDNSLRKLKEMAVCDSRIRVFHHDVSKSALGARKTGVENASGEYIMFMDADDYYVADACELVYKKIVEAKTDVLHFSAGVVNCGGVSQDRVDTLVNYMKPYVGHLKGSKVFDGCFSQDLYTHTPVNKIYKSELCKKAYSLTEDKRFVCAEDLYVYFIFSYYAESYYGWDSKPLYFYCYGRGLSGNSNFSIKKFENICSHAEVLKSLERFVKNNNAEIADIDKIIEKYRKEWFGYSIRVWHNNLNTEDLSQGLQLLCKYWGTEDTIAAIADKYWFERKELSKRIGKINSIKTEEKTVKNIAIYYYRYSVGGVERVLSVLMPMFINMGYNITLITDENPTENDFALPEGVKRVVIENSQKTNFKNRVCSWKKIIADNNIDLVLYAAWEYAIFFWDMLYLKNIDVSVVMHTHGVFSTGLAELKTSYSMMPNTYRLADAVIALSNTDKMFYEAYNDRVYYIPNPVSEKLLNVPAVEFDNKSVVWIGRVSDEKNPHAPFEIIKEVIKTLPETKLYLLGDFYDEKWKKLAADYKLTDNIVFTGMVNNVNDYIQKASVHLMTSSFEGFPMALVEAKAHSMPTVMFELPHLELGKKECGTINVPMNDCSRAADVIIDLLSNKEYWAINSINSEKAFNELKNFNFEKAWKDVFEGRESIKLGNDLVNRLIYTVDNNYEIGINEFTEYTPPKNFKELVVRSLNLVKTKGIRYVVRMCILTAKKILLK